jgi:cell division inhibitor SulA
MMMMMMMREEAVDLDVPHEAWLEGLNKITKNLLRKFGAGRDSLYFLSEHAACATVTSFFSALRFNASRKR